MSFEQLKQFRTEAYHLLGAAKDATFELMDAVLLSRSVYSNALAISVARVPSALAKSLRSSF